jgi:heterodisulfide reductase subunit D
MNLDIPEIRKMLQDYNIYLCLDCGKCSASCPLFLLGKDYSPRMTAHKVIDEKEDERYITESVWGCLTCGACYERCPSEVHYTDFIQGMRQVLKKQGVNGVCTHHGAMQTFMKMMTLPRLKQNRLNWVPDDVSYRSEGEILYFVGCAPYFDTFFENLNVKTVNTAIDSLRLLNFFDIEPVLLDNERCCGHDLYWTGEMEPFRKLVELNVEEFKRRGVKTIVTSCPEGQLILKKYYPSYCDDFPFEVINIIDFLDQHVEEGAVSFSPFKARVTFQDPCRLGRYMGNYDAPRRLLNSVPKLKLKEMEHSGQASLCCGNCGWTNCDSYAKALQVQRLTEARNTRADILVTACPKCRIHLTCAMKDPNTRSDLEIEIVDIISILSRLIKWVQSDEPE